MTSSPAPPITPRPQGGDEVVGDDVAAPGHVHEPGVRLHQRELARADDALGLGREGEGDDHEVGAGQRVGQPVALEHDVGAVHRLDPVAHHGDVAVERLEQPQQRLGDAAAAEDRDLGAEQVGALRALPRDPPGRSVPRPRMPGERQRERQLGDRLGVDALAARPDAVVVDRGGRTARRRRTAAAPTGRWVPSPAGARARPRRHGAAPTPRPRPRRCRRAGRRRR